MKLEQIIPARYHQRLLAWGAAGVCGFILTTMFVGIPKLGSLAWSQEVDQKIANAVDPITKQLTQVTKLATDGAAEVLVQSIFTATQQKCLAQADNQPAAFWTTRLIDLKKRYHELTGDEFPDLHCHDL
jgi:hypothetical protein